MAKDGGDEAQLRKTVVTCQRLEHLTCLLSRLLFGMLEMPSKRACEPVVN